MPRANARCQEGFGLVDVMAALTITVLGLVAVAAVLLSTSHQQDQEGARILALMRAEALMEEVKGSNPATLAATYDGMFVPVQGVIGSQVTQQVITVDVDDTDPTLLVVSVFASWLSRGAVETLTLRTDIFNSSP